MRWDYERIIKNRRSRKPIPVVRFHPTEETRRYKSLRHAEISNGFGSITHLKLYIESQKEWNGYTFEYQ